MPEFEPPSTAPHNSAIGRVAAILVISSAVIWFFTHGASDYFSFESLKARQSELKSYRDQHLIVVIVVFSLTYVAIAGCFIPANLPLTLLGGALFGRWMGTSVVLLASSAGALAGFLASRYIFRSSFERRMGSRLPAMRRHIERDGPWYLFALRLTPVIPFVLVNGAMGVLPIRPWTFWWVSVAGMAPGTFLFVGAGTELAQLESWHGLVSPSLIASLVAIALFSLVARAAVRRLKGGLSQ